MHTYTVRAYSFIRRIPVLLVSVARLRKGGVRLAAPEPSVEGYLRTERAGAGVATYLISNVGGSALCGPLFEARLLKADTDGLLLLGFEREGDAAVVQEWRVNAASPSFKPNGWPVPADDR
jgi:hypothetical protein